MIASDGLVELSACPAHMPEGWTPPVPAWGAGHTSDESVSVLYVGVEKPESGVLSTLDRIVSRTPPDVADAARFTSRGGCETRVRILYFASHSARVKWEHASGFADWFADGTHLLAGYGLWKEVYDVEPGRFETLISTPDGFEGLARRYGESVGPIREHAYWGGMEDRIPASASEDLTSALGAMPEPRHSDTRGQSIQVSGPRNLCLIRSGQDLTGADAGERDEYADTIEPHLSRGLAFLGEHPETGCFSSRYMTQLDADGRLLAKTFGMQLFLSVAHMARWARHHPSHMRIFDSFQAMAKWREGEFALRLWHEVVITQAGGMVAEYVNCDPATGLLPFRHALEPRSERPLP